MSAFATFEHAGHIYRDAAGIVVPSVTQAMALAGLDPYRHVPRRYLERAAAIGTAVHQATHFLDEGDLDLETLDQAIHGHVLAWQRFKVEEDFTPLEIERRGLCVDENGELAFGFCLDRLGMLKGEPALLDLKTPKKITKFMEFCYGVQTAGYSRAVNFEGKRASVHLHDDGTYKLIPHDRAGDFRTWQNALELAHDKLAAGAKIPN